MNKINTETEREIRREIRRVLNENYVLKPEGETDQDCQVHDLYAVFLRFLSLMGEGQVKRYYVEMLAGGLALLGAFGIVHQVFVAGIVFEWRQFWCHESLIALCLISPLLLLAGKYVAVGLSWRKRKGLMEDDQVRQ